MDTSTEKNPAAVALGRLGGSKLTPAKLAQLRAAAKRPRPSRRKPDSVRALRAAKRAEKTGAQK